MNKFKIGDKVIDLHEDINYDGLIGEVTSIKHYILVLYPFGMGHGTVVPYLKDSVNLMVVSNTKLGRLLYE